MRLKYTHSRIFVQCRNEPVVLVFRHLEREWPLPLGRLPLECGRQVRAAGFGPEMNLSFWGLDTLRGSGNFRQDNSPSSVDAKYEQQGSAQKRTYRFSVQAPREGVATSIRMPPPRVWTPSTNNWVWPVEFSFAFKHGCGQSHALRLELLQIQSSPTQATRDLSSSNRGRLLNQVCSNFEESKS